MSWERVRALDRRINERLGTTPEDIRRRQAEPPRWYQYAAQYLAAAMVCAGTLLPAVLGSGAPWWWLLVPLLVIASLVWRGTRLHRAARRGSSAASRPID